jgi:hypothetical protein
MGIAILLIAALAVVGVIIGNQYLHTQKRLKQKNQVNNRRFTESEVTEKNIAPKKAAQNVIPPDQIWLKKLPTAIRRALREENRSISLIYALLLDPHNNGVRHRQLTYLQQIENSIITEHIADLYKTIAGRVEDRWRLPLLGQALAQLKNTSEETRQHLLTCASNTLDTIKTASWHVPLAYLILEHSLQSSVDRTITASDLSIDDLWSENLMVLATIARAGHHKPEAIQHAFEAGALQLPRQGHADIKMPKECDWQILQECLEKIVQGKLADRKMLVAACTEVVAVNRQVSDIEADLLSTVAIILDCPLPTLLNRTPVAQDGTASSILA